MHLRRCTIARVNARRHPGRTYSMGTVTVRPKSINQLSRASPICNSANINHQSSIINHQSSIINHQSSIINHQSSIINHQSSIINHQSSIVPTILRIDDFFIAITYAQNVVASQYIPINKFKIQSRHIIRH
jgi:hypothetical protein